MLVSRINQIKLHNFVGACIFSLLLLLLLLLLLPTPLVLVAAAAAAHCLTSVPTTILSIEATGGDRVVGR